MIIQMDCNWGLLSTGLEILWRFIQVAVSVLHSFFLLINSHLLLTVKFILSTG